jgi:hypothetical protein
METLRIQNYNYQFDRFIDRVKTLIDSNVKSFGPVVQSTALSVSETEGTRNTISKITILRKRGRQPKSESLDYGSLILLRETFRAEELLKRLGLLADRKFHALGRTLDLGPSLGFSDRFLPSVNEYSSWPGRVFQITVGGNQPYLSDDLLLHYDLPSFASPYDAVKWFLDLPANQNARDICNGQISVFIPNYRCRIEKLYRREDSLVLSLFSKVPWNDLRCKIICARIEKSLPITIKPKARVVNIHLPFMPTHLQVWILSKQWGLLDFYEETELWNRGNRPYLLPKIEPTRLGAIHSIPFQAEPEEMGSEGLVHETVRLIVQTFDVTNSRFAARFGFPLFKIHELRASSDLARQCHSEQDFDSNVQVASCMVDWINDSGLRTAIQDKPPAGSINALEAFLKQEFPGYDRRVIDNFRIIKSVRKKYPTHRDSPEVLKAFEALDESYPPRDWTMAWLKLLRKFLESLNVLQELVSAAQRVERP